PAVLPPFSKKKGGRRKGGRGQPSPPHQMDKPTALKAKTKANPSLTIREEPFSLPVAHALADKVGNVMHGLLR
ncbi:MAG: hypothetical protein RSE94_22765, partial [Pseudomonas sp.]